MTEQTNHDIPTLWVDEEIEIARKQEEVAQKYYKRAYKDLCSARKKVVNDIIGAKKA